MGWHCNHRHGMGWARLSTEELASAGQSRHAGNLEDETPPPLGSMMMALVMLNPLSSDAQKGNGVIVCCSLQCQTNHDSVSCDHSVGGIDWPVMRWMRSKGLADQDQLDAPVQVFTGTQALR